jgi:peroxin-12
MKRRRRPGVSSERAQSAIDLFTDHEQLRQRERRWSLLFLVGIPYIRSKVDDLYETLGGGNGGDLFGDRPQAQSLNDGVSMDLIGLCSVN